MEEIIVIRAADPDGSVFQAVMDALKGKRAEVVDVSNLSASMLRIGDLEIHHEQRRVLMAGREVELNHGEYAMLYCMPVHQGRCSPKRSSMRQPGRRHISMEQSLWRISSGG